MLETSGNISHGPSSRRRRNPGRRSRGGTIYDSDLGITCHFCKQKTVTKHVLCRECVSAFCSRCLRLRHGEDVFIEREYQYWLCPKCRGGCGKGCKNCCNCRRCRIKQDLKPAKIIYSELQAQGFDNAHDYLVHLETNESSQSIMARKLGKDWCQTIVKKFKLNEGVKHHSQTEDLDCCTMEATEKESSCFHSDGLSKGPEATQTVQPDQSTSFPEIFRERENFRVELQKKLLEPFDATELRGKWDTFVSRKPTTRTVESRNGTSCFQTTCSSSSYIDCYPDFRDKLARATSKEEKLKLLRGFFFWLERASAAGAFKPWLAIENDDECIEIGADCEVLGVLLDVDKITPADQDMTSPNMSSIVGSITGDIDIKPNVNRIFIDPKRYVKKEINNNP